MLESLRKEDIFCVLIIIAYGWALIAKVSSSLLNNHVFLYVHFMPTCSHYMSAVDN